MRRVLSALIVLGLIGLGVAWWVTAPRSVYDAPLAGSAGDAVKGEMVFWAAGCASCHSAEGAADDARLVLAGGRAFPSPFGTFRAPNISTDTTHGIGGWTEVDFLRATLSGVSPDGQHYFPAFPYASYSRMEVQDARDLWAFMQTLPADATPSQQHDVGFPYNIRRAVGGWKFLYLNDDWVLDAGSGAQLQRGRYLVEALGHCAECHTPRDDLGGLQTSAWMMGAPDPSGTGRIPGITPAQLPWSAPDIAAYLKSGFTPEFDSAGGHMVEVIKNMGRLPDEDLNAIAAYLKAIP